jgi:hypothetical protein
VKTLIIALVLTVIGPAHVRVGPAVVPALWLLAAAELAAAAGVTWLAVRHIRRFRSSPHPRSVLAGAR